MTTTYGIMNPSLNTRQKKSQRQLEAEAAAEARTSYASPAFAALGASTNIEHMCASSRHDGCNSAAPVATTTTTTATVTTATTTSTTITKITTKHRYQYQYQPYTTTITTVTTTTTTTTTTKTTISTSQSSITAL